MENEQIGSALEEIYDLLDLEKPKNDSDTNSDKQLVSDETGRDYSVEELGTILAKMYNNPDASSKVSAIHMFGIKYGYIIKEKGYTAASLATAAGLNESYHAEITKGIRLYEAIKNNEYGIKFYEDEQVKKQDISEILKTKAIGGFNKIFYGAPGCGKSHHISQMLKDADVKPENIFRVTFHPEYMNCDFVGQVLPSVSEKIDPVTGEKKEVVKYQFNPGPFTLALHRAYKTSDMVYLIIEEINRGNAAAIFGDLFQLLDRVKDTSNVGYSGSEYPIRNPGVQDYLVRVGDIDVLIEGVKRDGISIPSNLTILATMNSSDQNVFTLDTAFKRRWLFEQISNDITKDSKHKYKGWYIPGTDVTWETFLIKLNLEILDYKVQNQTNEDKRLGKYFVTQDCLTESAMESGDVEDIAENFAYKVLEYVWNDVCKIGRDDWFDLDKYRTLEDLIEAFVHPATDASPLDVFRNIDFKD